MCDFVWVPQFAQDSVSPYEDTKQTFKFYNLSTLIHPILSMANSMHLHLMWQGNQISTNMIFYQHLHFYLTELTHQAEVWWIWVISNNTVFITKMIWGICKSYTFCWSKIILNCKCI